LSTDKLISTTKVETFNEMMHGGFTQGTVGEGSFGNKKPVPSMIAGISRNTGNMIKPAKTNTKIMIQPAKTKSKK